MRATISAAWSIILPAGERFRISGSRWKTTEDDPVEIEAASLRGHYNPGQVELTGPIIKKDGTPGNTNRVVVVDRGDQRLPASVRDAVIALDALVEGVRDEGAAVSGPVKA